MSQQWKSIDDPEVKPLIHAATRAQVAWENAIAAIHEVTGVDPGDIASGIALALFTTSSILGEDAVQQTFGPGTDRAESQPDNTDQEVDSK